MRILIVEDDYKQAEWLTTVITGAFPGSHVERIATESEFRSAFGDIAANPPSIIFLDMMLRWADAAPEMPPFPGDASGASWHRAGARCRQMLQAHESTRGVPLVIHTVLEAVHLRDELDRWSPNIVYAQKRSEPDYIIRLMRSLLAATPGLEDGVDKAATLAAKVVKRSGVFVSYSHRDTKWLEELQVSLKPYVRDAALDVWDDTKIATGDRWRQQISDALQVAKVAVLLVSRYFFFSDFIAQNELPPLLEAAEREGLRIMWIAVSASPYERSKIAAFQAANDPRRPLDTLTRAQRSREFVKIAEGIARAMEST